MSYTRSASRFQDRASYLKCSMVRANFPFHAERVVVQCAGMRELSPVPHYTDVLSYDSELLFSDDGAFIMTVS